ncbi:MAG TPA: hypothetical protein VFM10_12710, partial [Terriglobales bacterium]|nr:hypothetical protein [Terriglobales bacterium]
TVVITNAEGQQVAKLQGRGTAGINTVVWNTRIQSAGRGRGMGNPIDQLLPLGGYTVTLEVGAYKAVQKARIAKTQGWTLGPPAPQIIR